MAQRRRGKKQRGQLWGLILVLAVVFCALLVLVLLLGGGEEEPQTEPSTQDTTGASTPSTSEETWPLRSGWVEENGKTYYFEGGAPVQGAHAIEGKIYCFDADGALLGAGWQEIDGRRYYLDSDGSAYLGWLQQADGLYYLRRDGSMARGEVEIDGKAYYFTSGGKQIDLVNPWNYIPEGYEVDLVDLPSSISLEDKQVDASCYDALVEMLTDCQKAGHNVCVVSAYRTQEYQQKLFDNQVAKQMAALNCTREEAEVIAATISAVPGTSEHQLGLAVDIVDTQSWSLTEIQETLAGQQWLMENSWRYGFILRYPNGTTDETGIIYEPWHYRYVGPEVAAELHELGVTLEAYLAALE